MFHVLVGCSVEGEEEGVHIMHGPDGRSSGEAYVVLSSQDDVNLAMTKNKNHIGKRYIDGNYLLQFSSSVDLLFILD